jgi:hypothetical protein
MNRTLTRARLIATVVAVMREATARCMDPCAAAARAFPQLPGFVIAQIHALHLSLLCDDWLDQFCAEQEMLVDVTPTRRRRWFTRATD